MTDNKSTGEIISPISTDILIVGGGISGLSAAITIKEKNPKIDVLVVEKAFSGWSGQADRGGGILAFITPADTVEDFISYHVNNIGCFLEDQELLSVYAHTCNNVLDLLDSWGAKLNKEKDGRYKYVKNPGVDVPWGLAGIDLDMCRRLNKRARKLGVKFLNKVTLVDLLKTDGHASGSIGGAIGFHVENGSCCLVRAKTTILANGNQNFQVVPMFASGRGDGIAAAYRAGAKMRNAEFGSFFNMVHAVSREVIFGAEDYMYNARGENISTRIRPEPQCDICSQSSIGWYKAHMNQNGPIKVKNDENLLGIGSELLFSGDMVWDRPVANAFWSRLWEKCEAATGDEKNGMSETVPGFLGSTTPVRVDHHMATSLPGLYAVGDVSYNGSAWTGAVPSPPGRIRGTGLMNAVWSAHRGALAAADDVVGIGAPPAIDDNQVALLTERILAPLSREKGVAALDLIHDVQDAMTPVKYSNFKSEQRMKEALDMVLAVKHKLPALKAEDPHELARCNEAESMALCAEMFYRASLTRKESRGWFFREDYPETDDTNWLKWIILEEQEGEMVISTEDIPIERYPIKP